jgi:iron complex outermembrane receptor protein
MTTYSINRRWVAAASLAILAGPASAQEVASDKADVGEIIVTARRTAERLQDVPISMTVYNQQQLTDRNIVLASDLATYTPSLSVNQRFGAEKSSFSLRGFNQDQNTAPTVGVYFADVVGLRAQGGTTSGNSVGAGAFMDLENVQVLKGPQGTLFGRNTTGGAILLVPTKPTDRLEGWVEGQAGDYDMRREMGVFNLPVSDTFKLRLAVDHNERDGYMENHSGIGPDAYNDIGYTAVRLSAVANLTPELENYTIFSYSDSSTNGFASRIVSCDRNETPLNFVRYATAAAACDQVDRQAARGDKLTDVEVGVPNPAVNIKQWQAINTTTWNASDTLTLKNIASYGKFREQSHFNLYSENFFVPQPLPGAGTPFQYLQLDHQPGTDNASQSTATEELQLQGHTADERLSWVLGGYLEFSRPDGYSVSRTSFFGDCSSPGALQCSAPLGFGIIFDARTKFDFDNHGIFAQGTYHLTDKLSITAGARETFDKIHAVDESVNYNVLPAGGLVGVCNDSLRFNIPNPTAGQPPFPLVVTSPSQCHKEIDNNSQKPTWLVDLDYKPNDNLMLYGKYSRGYRQGGISFTSPGVETWDPEKVDAFEIGAKTSFRGAVHGYFDIAAFYNDFTNQQIFGALIAKPGSGQIGGLAIINAGKSTIQGIEIESSVTLFDSLKLDAGYTYLDTKVKSLTAPTLDPNGPYLAVIPTASVGDVLTLSPKNRVTLTATYTLPLDRSIGEISLGATYTHTDSNVANASVPADTGVLPSTDLLNLNVSWNSVMTRPVDVALFATNITNQLYAVNTGGGYVSAGIGDVLIGPPRMYGVRLRYSFGKN